MQTFTAPISLGAVVPISITAVGARYAGQVVVASVTPIVAGIYRPTWSVTPGWAMAASGALAGIHTPQGASQHRVFLPVVLR